MNEEGVSTYSQLPLIPNCEPLTPWSNLDQNDLQNVDPSYYSKIDQFFNIQQNLTYNVSAPASPTENVAEKIDPTVLTAEKIVQECLDRYFRHLKKYLEIYVVSLTTPVFPFEKIQDAHEYSLCLGMLHFDNLCRFSTCLSSENHEILKRQFVFKVQEIHSYFETKNQLQLDNLVTWLLRELKTDFKNDISLRYNKLFASKRTPGSVVSTENASGLKFYSQDNLAKDVESLSSTYISRCNEIQSRLVDQKVLQNEGEVQDCNQSNNIFREAKQWIQEYGEQLKRENSNNQNLVTACLNKTVSDEYELQRKKLVETIQTKVIVENLKNRVEEIIQTITSVQLQIFVDSSVDCCPIFKQHMETILKDKAEEFRLSCFKCYQNAQIKAVTETGAKWEIPDLLNTMDQNPVLIAHSEEFTKLLQKGFQKAAQKAIKDILKKRGCIDTNENLDANFAPPMPPDLPHSSQNTDSEYDSDATVIIPRNVVINYGKRKNDQQQQISHRSRIKRAHKSDAGE